jgi:AmmeMemoRadiSam system protein A
MPEALSTEERQQLLQIARQSIEAAVRGEPMPDLDMDCLTTNLRELGATFVTLTAEGVLRGCIGALDPYQPLAKDVREHAIGAALNDFRFSPVQADELDKLQIEISRLGRPEPLAYDSPQDILATIRPGSDGVILKDGSRRATFLPQVWEKLPNPAQFLSHLCQKMGAPPDLWRRKKLEIYLYQVEDFSE